MGADTAVAQIGRLVEEAQVGKAPVQRRPEVSSGGDGATAGVRTVSDGRLPFTGLELISIALAGLALLSTGFALVRRSRPSQAMGEAE